jgi:hypothetical protein
MFELAEIAKALAPAPALNPVKIADRPPHSTDAEQGVLGGVQLAPTPPADLPSASAQPRKMDGATTTAMFPPTFAGVSDQRGYLFTVLKRQGDLVLLEKSNPGHRSGQKFWEVCYLHTRQETHWPDGRVTPSHEALPSSQEWGQCGYSPATLEAAEKLFQDLAARGRRNLYVGAANVAAATEYGKARPRRN